MQMNSRNVACDFDFLPVNNTVAFGGHNILIPEFQTSPCAKQTREPVSPSGKMQLEVFGPACFWVCTGSVSETVSS